MNGGCLSVNIIAEIEKHDTICLQSPQQQPFVVKIYNQGECAVFQKLIIIGNLGKDPEMRYMPDGKAVTSFNVATTSRWTDKSSGQPKEETTWFRVTVWGRQAETANQYLSKGSKVLVEGRIKPDPTTGGPRLWQRQDGTVGASFEVNADDIRFMSAKGEGGTSGGGSYEDSPAHQEDDIPF